MKNDPYSYDSDGYSQRAIISNLIEENEALKTDLGEVLNSKGWKALDVARHILRLKHKNKQKTNKKQISNIKSLHVDESCYPAYTQEQNTDYSKLEYKSTVKALAFCDSIQEEDLILLKNHSVYGICLEYNKKEDTKKTINLLSSPKNPLPFCLFVKYEREIAPETMLKNIETALRNPNYIRINSRLLLLLKLPDDIDTNTYICRLKEKAESEKIDELLIWCQNDMDSNENIIGANALFDLAFDDHHYLDFCVKNEGKTFFDYGKLVNQVYEKGTYLNHAPVNRFHYSCLIPAQRPCISQNNSIINYTPQLLYKWVSLIVGETKRRFPDEERIILVNLFNQNKEQINDYASMNALSKAILELPLNNEAIILDGGSQLKMTKANPRIAVQAHVYYVDVLPELLAHLSLIPYSFDLYISTNSPDKKILIEKKATRLLKNCKKLKVEVTKNVGRDIYPFLHQLSKCFLNYDAICHIHTKKTTKQYFGDSWRQDSYRNLFGSKENIKQILSLLSKKDTGIIAPNSYYIFRETPVIDPINKENVFKLLTDMGLPVSKVQNNIIFPIGSMFWMNPKSIKMIFDMNLTEKDFPEELGQEDGTIAHAIERLFGIVPHLNGYINYRVINKKD